MIVRPTLDDALSELQPGMICLSKQKNPIGNYKPKTYIIGKFEDIKNIYTNLDPSLKHHDEIILSAPCQLYIDIDCALSHWKFPVTKFDDTVQKVRMMMRGHAKEIYGLDIEKGFINITASGPKTDSPNDFKFSHHILNRCIIFPDPEETELFVLSLVYAIVMTCVDNVCVKNTEVGLEFLVMSGNIAEKAIIDLGIYRPRGSLRIVDSIKIEDLTNESRRLRLTNTEPLFFEETLIHAPLYVKTLPKPVERSKKYRDRYYYIEGITEGLSKITKHLTQKNSNYVVVDVDRYDGLKRFRKNTTTVREKKPLRPIDSTIRKEIAPILEEEFRLVTDLAAEYEDCPNKQKYKVRITRITRSEDMLRISTKKVFCPIAGRFHDNDSGVYIDVYLDTWRYCFRCQHAVCKELYFMTIPIKEETCVKLREKLGLITPLSDTVIK